MYAFFKKTCKRKVIIKETDYMALKAIILKKPHDAEKILITELYYTGENNMLFIIFKD